MMRPPFRPPLTHTADRPLDVVAKPAASTAEVAPPVPSTAAAPTGCGKPGCCRVHPTNQTSPTPAPLGPRTKPV